MWTETISRGLMQPGAGELCCNLFVLYMFCTVLFSILYVCAIVNCKHDSDLVCIDQSPYLIRLRTCETPYFHPRVGVHLPGMALPRITWIRLRLRTDVGRFRSCLYKWSMTPSAACECGAEEQTVDHVVLQCPIQRTPMEWMVWRYNRMAAQHLRRDLQCGQAVDQKNW